MVNELFKLTIDIYRMVDIPTYFVKSIIIPIPKKTTPKKCVQYQTISLLSHVSKILTKIISKRIGKKIEDILSKDQFRFRKKYWYEGSNINFKINNDKKNTER